MNTEILPVTLEQKAIVINNIREHTIPTLVKRDYDSDHVLRILHRGGIWYAKPDTIEREFLDKSYIAFYAGIEPLPTNKEDLDYKIAELRKDTNKFSPYGYYLKGHYRILGCFAANDKIAQFAPEAKDYFTASIPVVTKDYHQPLSPIYYPPIFNVNKYMGTICNNFDNRIEAADDYSALAKVTADFYFWGLAMVHSFIGGNHRAYDRFIEYAFAKKGISLTIPLNDTLNIDNNDPFNIAIFSERNRLMEIMGPKNQTFDMVNFKDMNKWLLYQHQLNEMLLTCLNQDCAQTEKAAEAILNWL